MQGTQAEYVRIPHAQANLAKIPAGLKDEQVVLLADIASTGISGAESGGVRIGDAVKSSSRKVRSVCVPPWALD